MNLGNYMDSVGFGFYGNAADTLKAGLTTLVKGAVGQVAGPVEVTTPAALKGAKLTTGFKIVEEGTAYKIILDADIPGLGSFTGKTITGKEPVKENILGVLTLEYIPPPTNYVPFIIGGAVAVAGLLFWMGRGKAAAPARKRKSRKRRRKGRKSRKRRRR